MRPGTERKSQNPIPWIGNVGIVFINPIVRRKGGQMKVYDIIWKRRENENGKARWERVGVLLKKDEGKMSIKLDLLPIGNWDGWFVVSERRNKID